MTWGAIQWFDENENEVNHLNNMGTWTGFLRLEVCACFSFKLTPIWTMMDLTVLSEYLLMVFKLNQSTVWTVLPWVPPSKTPNHQETQILHQRKQLAPFCVFSWSSIIWCWKQVCGSIHWVHLSAITRPINLNKVSKGFVDGKKLHSVTL